MIQVIHTTLIYIKEYSIKKDFFTLNYRLT